MRHYCTLTDIHYLPRALVLYESLVKHSSEEFNLQILAMDPATEVTLDELRLDYVGVNTIPSSWDEIRNSRIWQEFCWTMASQHALVQMQFGSPEITYLDADMMFFSDPKQVFDEIGERSIGIIPHRFIPEKAHLAVNGQFNVSWVSFKNTPTGRECLSRWAQQVREKCSATEGCGDQKYLDEWPALYGDEVCIIQNPGAGLAPWNMANYDLCEFYGRSMLKGHSETFWKQVVFFHAHEFAQASDGSYQFSNYRMRKEDVDLIWRPYAAAYERAKERIESLRIQSR